jgi:hypothetical protein
MRIAEHSDTQLTLLDTHFFILYLIFICLVDEGNLRKVKKQKRRENDKREKEKKLDDYVVTFFYTLDDYVVT